MSDVQLSIPERSALLALMSFARDEVSNTEIHARYGFTVDKPVRESLEKAGYLTASKKPRTGFVHTLKDDGWARCRSELSAPLPSGAQRGYRLLAGLLGCLDQYLSVTGLTLADFLDPQNTPDAEIVSHAPGDDGQSAVDRLRSAYDELAQREDAWVGLVRLREALPDLSRQEFDDALLQLDLRPYVSLIPEVNQKTLTAGDRAAAIHVGGEDKHLLQIRSV